MKQEILIALAEIRQRYDKQGLLFQNQELKIYTIDNVEGIVYGYTLMIKRDGRIRPVDYRGDEFRMDELVEPKYLNSHQRRVKKDKLNEVKNNLTRNGILKKRYNSFEELYDDVRKEAHSLLLSYDIAKRIGHCMGIAPQDYVYLQCGAKEAAKALRDKGLIPLSSRIPFRVGKSVFSGIFPDMTPINIENMLCVYKNDFEKL